VIEAALVGSFSLVSPNVGAGPWVVAHGAGHVVSGNSGEAWAAAIVAALERPARPDVLLAAQEKLMRELAPAAIAGEVLACWSGRR